MYIFGVGDLIAIPVAGTVTAANPTPIKFGTLQDASVDVSFSQKELFGKSAFPVAIARTQGKIQVKAKFASIYAKALNDYFWGQTVSAGEAYAYIDEIHAPVVSNTATATNHTGGIIDQGVIYNSNQAPLTLVASAPAVGQYSVTPSTGVYLFASGDTSATAGVRISYLNTPAGTPGFSSIISNPAMGAQPTFSIVLANNQYQGNRFMIQLNSCISSKITYGLKNEDFMIPEFDLSAFADAGGILGTFSYDQ